MKVAYVGLKLDGPRTLGPFEIHGVSLPRIDGFRWSFRGFLRDGAAGVTYDRAVLSAQHVDDLYRTKDPHYMAAVDLLLKNLADYDILIFSTYCPIHPEIIAKRLADKIKVLGFTDDPHSTYVRGIPFLWAFDAAYYISPGYSQEMGFAELFDRMGYARARWLPLAQPITYPQLSYQEILDRSVKVAYVGCPTGSKIDRLRILDEVFGADFKLYGRWRMKGYYGYFRPLLGEPLFPRRVKAISASEKNRLYNDTQIGFNMHVSDLPSECGNMRTYETAGYGMMPLCDRAGLNMQRQIFEEGREAVYYSDMQEAIDLINHYLNRPEERAQIAWAAHQKARQEYGWEKVTLDFLNWLVEDFCTHPDVSKQDRK